MRKPRKSDIPTVMQGQAGVYRVASELLMRKFHVCFPAADGHGVDLVLESGVRIQVKSAHLGTYGPSSRQACYQFAFAKTKFASASGKLRKELCSHSDKCDFVVLWGIDTDKFWIVPAALVDHKGYVQIGEASRYQDVDNSTITDMLAQGKTWRQTARELGITTATVSRRLSGKVQEPKSMFVAQIRACENRWDLVRELELSRQPQGKLIEMPAVEAVAS